MSRAQNKCSEIEFFDRHAEEQEYDVFTDTAKKKLVDAFMELTGVAAGASVADLGCGSGAFTRLLAERGFVVTGVDLSPKLIALARQRYPDITFEESDIESLHFKDGSFDAVMLSGVIHHLPDPVQCVQEVYRILHPGGTFFAFDPNRINPFMYLYRDRSSPFYSSKGVTLNERPVIAGVVRKAFAEAGFNTCTAYLGGLPYRYVASEKARSLLRLYNKLDALLSTPSILTAFRPFVLTYGEKPLN